MYTITTYKNGRTRTHRFETLEAAKSWAAEFFRMTGIIVGIEREGE